MLLPARILKPGQENMVCKLKKALYGLKQAGWEWQKTLTAVFHWQAWFSTISSRPLNLLLMAGRRAHNNHSGDRQYGCHIKMIFQHCKVQNGNSKAFWDSQWWWIAMLSRIQDQMRLKHVDHIYQSVQLHWKDGQKISTYQCETS